MSKSGGPYDFAYVNTDIPEGMTIRDWRAQGAAKRSTVEAAARADRRRQRAGPPGGGPRLCVCRSASPGCAAARHTGESPAGRPRCARRRGRLRNGRADRRPPAAPAGVALGSPVLLHAERALAMLAVLVAMLSIGLHAARGRLPIELSTSGLRYEAEAADRAAAAVAELQAQYDDLLAVVDALDDRLDAPQRRP
jgi:hypothetical protein